MSVPRHPGLADSILGGASAMGVAITAGQARQLSEYLRLLDKWNRRINLTAIRDPAEMVPRHVLDSFASLPWVRGPRVLDVGSGAGLPGIPLAIMRPELRICLVDSRGKRIQFLIQAVAQLDLRNVETVHGPVQQYRPREKFDTLVARAFAAIPELFSATNHLYRREGRILALKGRRPDAELRDLERSQDVATTVHRVDIPGIRAQRHVVVIEPRPGPSPGKE